MTRQWSERVIGAATVAVVALTMGASCRPVTVESGAQPAPAGSFMTMTDANVASIAMTANMGEVQLGQLALQKSQNNAVREFARRMVDEHTALEQNFQGLLAARNIAPAANQTTQQLNTSTQQTMASLQARTGADFDRAYMTQQVAQHRWLLLTIDQALLPSTTDTGMRRALMSGREVVERHLTEAEQILGNLPPT